MIFLNKNKIYNGKRNISTIVDTQMLCEIEKETYYIK